MKLSSRRFALAALSFLAFQLRAASPAPPLRGLHLMAPGPDDLPLAVRFIKEALPKEGVNVLVLEFDYRYRFTKRPEVADPDSLSLDNVKTLVEACRQAGVRLIPQINLLGHQSWARATGSLLRVHPEFDETPGKYPQNEGIYCRSYCPLHPQVHDVVFDLIDELADACESDAFHVGMDEVFLLGEDDCPRCKGKDKAELFAQEVRVLHDHLARSNRAMWMWGDRFLDGETTGIGKWEASVIKTHPAIYQVPEDIVICDWHYDRSLPTPQYFAVEGFPVLACPWRRPDVALAQLESVRQVRLHSTDAIAARMLGLLQTTWTGIAPFARAYFGEAPPAGARPNPDVQEALSCFRSLFRELRALDGR
ncbi:MAG TPA: family 20 glycosylhydrolase [Bryobacteraceae bacterium]|nr:family 20 glycosylhydrolase [Bryobacteraceae bacterium]